jgi:cytoskeleton protein RodZ
VAATEAASVSGLVLRSRGEAWVEVTDAKGVVRIRKTLTAGETAAIAGPMPLSVVIGRADVTEVEVRGKAFSLEKIAKDNVARFEVK